MYVRARSTIVALLFTSPFAKASPPPQPHVPIEVTVGKTDGTKAVPASLRLSLTKPQQTKVRSIVQNWLANHQNLQVEHGLGLIVARSHVDSEIDVLPPQARAQSHHTCGWVAKQVVDQQKQRIQRTVRKGHGASVQCDQNLCFARGDYEEREGIYLVFSPTTEKPMYQTDRTDGWALRAVFSMADTGGDNAPSALKLWRGQIQTFLTEGSADRCTLPPGR